MNELLEEVVRPQSLVQAVADTLKRKIFSGEFPEGTPFPEVQLSEALKVSRGTVREALRQLYVVATWARDKEAARSVRGGCWVSV